MWTKNLITTYTAHMRHSTGIFLEVNTVKLINGPDHIVVIYHRFDNAKQRIESEC